MYKKLYFFECESERLCVVLFLAGTLRLFVVIKHEPSSYLNVTEVIAHILQIPYCLVHLDGLRSDAHSCLLRQPRHYTEAFHRYGTSSCFQHFSFDFGVCFDDISDVYFLHAYSFLVKNNACYSHERHTQPILIRLNYQLHIPINPIKKN